MSKAYYVVIEKMAGAEKWCVAFGDYARDICQDEMAALKDGACLYAKTERPSYRLIKSHSAKQRDIESALAVLNA